MTDFSIVGSGPMARIHAGVINMTPRARLLRVASRVPANAQRFALPLDIDAVSVDEVPGPTRGLIVATNPTAMESFAERCAQRHVGVLLERPMATTLAQADRILALAATTQAPFAYGENLLCSPVFGGFLEALHRCGPPHHLDIDVAAMPPSSFGARRGAWGGGVAFQQGCSAVVLAAAALSPAKPISVFATFTANDWDIEESAKIVITFEGGAKAHLSLKWSTSRRWWTIQAATDNHAVHCEIIPQPTLEVDGKPAVFDRASQEGSNLVEFGYFGQFAAFAEAVANRGSVGVPVSIGRLALDLVCCAAVSANRNEPVPFPFQGNRDRSPFDLWKNARS